METNQENPGEVQDQIADYHADINQIHLEGYEIGVKKARNALFWAAGLIFLGEAIVYAQSGLDIEPIGITIIAVIAGTFIGLALWTKKKPYTAIVSGIIAFILYILLVATINGYVDGALGVVKGLFGGLLVKILIFVALIRPLKDAKELQKAKEEEKAG
jgi:hypothetical protein